MPAEPEAMRVRLGANPATAPALLAELATDACVTVRAALALNPRTPAEAVERLARDEDERVRALLARRLAALAPSFRAEEQRRLEDHAMSALARLVADEAERVRAALSDVVKDMPDAPRELILRLARDSMISVSEPVIRFSPVLTNEDLLGILRSPPCAESARAVARRPGLTAEISDAILASEDSTAIRHLLENHSAQIREAALDALIARAGEETGWHEPLVRRPALTQTAARALADIVATHLLDALSARPDLPAPLTRALRERLAARLAAEAARQDCPELGTYDALAEAQRLSAAGELTQSALIAALDADRVRLGAAILAVAAVVPITVVDRAASLRSGRGLVSLVWAAGFDMRAAARVQAVIGQLPPGAVLAAAADGGFPLVREEMRWQIDFLRRAAR